MKPCKNRVNGCPRWLSNDLGARTHLRSCKWVITKLNDNNRKSVPTTLGGNKFRLQCDDLTFQNEKEANEENSFIMKSVPTVDRRELKIRNGTLRYQHLGDDERSSCMKLSQISMEIGKKKIDEILYILRKTTFDINLFSSSFISSNSCLDMMHYEIQTRFGEHGFQKRVVRDLESNISYELYVRSAVAVIRDQVRGCSDANTLFEPPTQFGNSSIYVCHPMQANVGLVGVPKVKKAIMESHEPDAFWRMPSQCGEASFIGLIQIYSDKSKTSLQESAFTFHPIHITLMNFSEQYRRTCVVSGKSFLAFLPVHYKKEGDYDNLKKGISREVRIRLMHEAINTVVAELKAFAYKGFTCIDSDQKIRRCHPCIASYCSDLPEAKDMTSVKNGNTSIRNCHRCSAQTGSFNLHTNEPSRSGKETRDLILKAINLKKEGKGARSKHVLRDLSLVDQLPWILDFPFVGIDPILDLHSLFSYEPLHNMHLGISKLLKTCLSERLQSETILTSSLPTKLGNPRTCTFKTIRMTILNGINYMLSHIQRSSPAKGLNIDFTNHGKGDYGNGLYVDEGRLVGMLQGKDYKAIDLVSPFLGMLVDRCCGETTTCPVTTIFVQYADIVSNTLCYNGDYRWCDNRISNLDRKIGQFKNDTLKVFGAYHASNLRTEKFHLLDHITDDIRRLGGILWGDASLYEYTHTLVKAAYKCGSKRKTTAMDETVFAFVAKLFASDTEKDMSDQGNTIESQTDHRVFIPRVARAEAMQGDSAAMVKKDLKFELQGVEKARSIHRKMRKASENYHETEKKYLMNIWKSLDQVVRDIVSDVGEDGTRVLLSQIKNIIQKEGWNINDVTIRRVTSGYVAGRGTPSASNYNQSLTGIQLKESNSRISQRFVSGRGFYGSSYLRQDCVLIQAESDESDSNLMWVGKTLGLFRLSSKRVLTPIPEGSSDNEKELVFVQYFQVEPPTDNIDRTLRCISLARGKRDDNENENEIGGRAQINKSHYSSATYQKWFDLLPSSTLRGVVHVIRSDYGKDGIGVVKSMDMVPWYEQQFYINRFYHDFEQRMYAQ